VNTNELDCGCTGNVWHGCKVDPKESPPKGHICWCKNWGVLCSGSVIECTNNDAPGGCSGCSDFECCGGDCSGYAL
jgi:hypothetical protein